MDKYLSPDFLTEVFKSCITSDTFIDICTRYLEFHYIPVDSYKRVWREISNHYELDSTRPTIGVLSEKLSEDEDCILILKKIKNCDVSGSKKQILKQLEKFIKTAKFKSLFESTKDIYNEGKKDEAIEELVSGAVDIGEFSIDSQKHSTVFASFEERQKKRVENSLGVREEIKKVPFGIHPLDYYTRGGGDKGRSSLVMAISGGGKSTFLRWVGISAARIGLRVVHFQCEGTEEEALDAYDSAWTSVDLQDIEFGSVPKRIASKIKKVNQDIINKGGEVFVHATEEIDAIYIEECPQVITDIERDYGKVDLAIFDYLELFNHKGSFPGQFGERQRREKIANKITNIAVKFKIHCIAATQAQDIKKDLKDDPDFVMTSNHLSEFKGALKPFSYFFTINQTTEEYEDEIIRIHIDKLRKYKSKKTFKIAQSLSNSRFYNSAKTLNLFWDEHLNKPRE